MPRIKRGPQETPRRRYPNLVRELASEDRRVPPEHEAYVRLALGEGDAAIELLRRAVADRDPGILWMAVDPRLDPLRNDPRLTQLLIRLGAPSS